MSGQGEKAGETWRQMRGDEELMAMPRAVAIRLFLFSHLDHHRGELSTYLRACGEAVPSILRSDGRCRSFRRVATPPDAQNAPAARAEKIIRARCPGGFVQKMRHRLATHALKKVGSC